MKKLLAQSLYALLLIPLLTLTACGSDDDDEDNNDDFVGAARVAVRNAPNTIDTGDRTRVKVAVSQVHENGILLKVFFPEGLEYVPNSGRLLTLEEQDEDEIPSINPAINTPAEDGSYLVFFLIPEDFEDQQGILEFQLVGVEAVDKSEIEVDADVNDPEISDDVEFDLENPLFAAESSSSIEVTE